MNNTVIDPQTLEQATLEEAIALFLADQCSLGRAAELANVTRWDILDALQARGIVVHMGDTAMDSTEQAQQIARLESFL